MAGCDYANARIGAMRGRLLRERGIAELLAEPDLASRLEYLKKTTYGEALTAQLARTPDLLRGADRGLRARLMDDLLQIDRFLTGERVRSLLGAVLAFEDAWNLKTVLRGIARGEPPDRIFPLLAPTPGFDEAALEELVGQKEVKAVVDLLATWSSPYAAVLGEALGSSLARGDLFRLEVALDRFLFARALETARSDGEDGRILLGILEAQIDLTNAGTLLKLAGDARAQEFYIAGGRRLGLERFQQLAVLGERELREALSHMGRLHLDPRLAGMGEHGDPFQVDQLLQEALGKALGHEARLHPLSIAVPLAFLFERRAEIRRILLVLRGAEFGLPADELLALVGQ